MSASGQIRMAALLLEQLHSAALHLGAAQACLDASVGIAQDTGTPSVPWDMGLQVGGEVARYAAEARRQLDEPLRIVEVLVDRAEDFLRALNG